MYARGKDALLVLHQLYTTSDGVGANLQALLPVLRQLWGQKGIESRMALVFAVLDDIQDGDVGCWNVGGVGIWYLLNPSRLNGTVHTGRMIRKSA